MERKSIAAMAEEETAMEARKRRAYFVLIHGAGLGAWCWYKMKCLMEASGFSVTCIDLKSSGLDPSLADSLSSFDDYNQPLLQFLSSLPRDEQVILVGHSAGGHSVTQAARRFPEKISLAVYVAGVMLKFGFQNDQDLKDGVPDLSEHGEVLELRYALGPENPPTSAIVKPEFQRQLLYQTSPQEDCALAALLMRPAPIPVIHATRFESEKDQDEGLESVPRVYIKTMQDRIIKPEQQDSMIRRWEPSQVYAVDSDHSPFFSNPSVLFGFLMKAATSVGYIL